CPAPFDKSPGATWVGLNDRYGNLRFCFYVHANSYHWLIQASARAAPRVYEKSLLHWCRLRDSHRPPIVGHRAVPTPQCRKYCEKNQSLQCINHPRFAASAPGFWGSYAVMPAREIGDKGDVRDFS